MFDFLLQAARFYQEHESFFALIAGLWLGAGMGVAWIISRGLADQPIVTRWAIALLPIVYGPWAWRLVNWRLYVVFAESAEKRSRQALRCPVDDGNARY